MGKLEIFDRKATRWEGLWYQPGNNYYSSYAFNLSRLKQFKGPVRLYVRKNKWYNGGENSRPNYVFSLCDANADNPCEIEVKDIEQPVGCCECGEPILERYIYCPNCGEPI